MKQLIQKILVKIVTLISKVFRYRYFQIGSRVKRRLFSIWIEQEFLSCGKNFRVTPSIRLIGAEFISIGDDFSSGEMLRLECWDKYLDSTYSPQLTIGNNVILNNNNHIGCINKVVIGNDVLLGSNILITDHQHGFVDDRDLNLSPSLRPLYSAGPIVIEDQVWIGDNVSILPNVVIGKGAIIGANSVVTKNIPGGCVAGGTPAKVIRYLNRKENERNENAISKTNS